MLYKLDSALRATAECRLCGEVQRHEGCAFCACEEGCGLHSLSDGIPRLPHT